MTSPSARLPTAPFGRTGHDSTRVVFGAASLGRMSQERADATLAIVSEFGVNHVDTAASYGDSELRLAPWLREHRQEVFLATKTGDRSGPDARASLERSLERLGVDHVDLVQLHNLVEPDEWEVAHGPGGAVEALTAARAEGLTRHIGVTGHGLRIARAHLRSLEAFDYDSVLLPYNFVLLRNPDYRRDVEALLATCEARGVAVQTIKSLARRRWAPDDTRPHFSWYEPIDDVGALARSVRWVLGRPGLFLNSSSDATLLRATLDAASTPGPVPTDDELEADVAGQGIQPLFDGGALERI
ncbi:MAG TPA: aldo/keto reductase [Acidimicrobiales bacterium]|nr:aldo/keto reductase [Acidimicrobiales bacterium]